MNLSFKLKKAAAVLTVAGTLSLCGCGSKLPFVQQKPDFNGTYTVSAEITYNKTKAKAVLTRINSSEWEFKFSEPKAFEGLTVNLNDSSYAASLGGLSFSSDNSGIYAAAPQLIAKSIGKLTAANDSITASDGVLTFTGDIDGKRLSVTADEHTGNLISLKIPTLKLAVNFSNQKPFTLDLPEEGDIS